MSFNAQSAITFNKACNYPSNTIKVILDEVRAPFGFEWNVPGVTAISQWQKSNNLDADGMVGLKSLNKMIADLTACGKTSDASLLKKFIADAQARQAAAKKDVDSIVASFKPASIVFPFRFEKEIAPHPQYGNMVPSWAARGTFEVSLKLNPNLSLAERMCYEYRQYIKGTVYIKDGTFVNNRWEQTMPVRIVNVGEQFAVPNDPLRPGKGLTPHYKEDGKTAEGAGNKEFRFGYRGDGIELNGKRFKSVWSPHPASGGHLVLRDTPGYGENYTPGLAPNIHMDFTFRGVVVEVAEAEDANGNAVSRIVREVTDRIWNFKFNDALRWSDAVPAVKN